MEYCEQIAAAYGVQVECLDLLDWIPDEVLGSQEPTNDNTEGENAER